MTKFIYQFTKSTAVSHCLRYFPKIASEVPLGVHQSTDTHPYTSHSSSPLHGRHCWQLPQSWCIQGHTPGCRTLVYRGTLPHTSHCPLQPHRSCCMFFHPFHRRGRKSRDRFFLIGRGTPLCTQHFLSQPHRCCCMFFHPFHRRGRRSQDRFFLIGRGTPLCTQHFLSQPHRCCRIFFHPFHRRGRRSLDIFFLVCRGTLPCSSHYPPQPGRSCCKFSPPCHTQDHTGQSRSFLIILPG